MPQRWAIWLAIEGNLRFGSHHDLMRAMERTAERAGLVVEYSQGFNPRPRLSLVCPRSVGLATEDDLLVLSLDAPIEGDQLLAKLSEHAPEGIRFVRAEQLVGSRAPQPVRTRHELNLPPDKLSQLPQRLNELQTMPSWPVERQVSAGRRKSMRAKTIDLRPSVEEIYLEGKTLHVTLVRQDDMWARPGEVLRLVGLDDRVDLARMVRTKVEYEMETAGRQPTRQAQE